MILKINIMFIITDYVTYSHLETLIVTNGSTASRNGSLKYEVVTTVSATGGDTLFEIRPKHDFPVNIK